MKNTFIRNQDLLPWEAGFLGSFYPQIETQQQSIQTQIYEIKSKQDKKKNRDPTFQSLIQHKEPPFPSHLEGHI